MNDTLQGLMDKFNTELSEDESKRKELEGIERTIKIELSGEITFFKLDDTGLVPLEDTDDDPDIYISTTEEVLLDLIEGRADPMMSYMMGKLVVQASMEDIMKVKGMFGA